MFSMARYVVPVSEIIARVYARTNARPSMLMAIWLLRTLRIEHFVTSMTMGRATMFRSSMSMLQTWVTSGSCSLVVLPLERSPVLRLMLVSIVRPVSVLMLVVSLRLL